MQIFKANVERVAKSLNHEGPVSFGDIRKQFSISPASLSTVLRALLKNGFIEKSERGYYLTVAGYGLLAIIKGMHERTGDQVEAEVHQVD